MYMMSFTKPEVDIVMQRRHSVNVDRLCLWDRCGRDRRRRPLSHLSAFHLLPVVSAYNLKFSERVPALTSSAVTSRSTISDPT